MGRQTPNTHTKSWGSVGIIHTAILQMAQPETRDMNWGSITMDHWETMPKMDGRRVCKFSLSFSSCVQFID